MIVSLKNKHNTEGNMFCTKCGNPIDGSANFCTRCGAPVRIKIDIDMGQTLNLTIARINELYNNPTEENKNEIFRLATDAERKYPVTGKLMAILGSIYLNAIGTVEDLKKAEHYLRLAVQSNETDAYFDLGLLLSLNTDKECIIWLEKAMSLGKTDAMIALGDIYTTGDFIDVDIQKALYYYNCALQSGDNMALRQIGALYYCGDLGEENKDKAFSYIKAYVKLFPDDGIGAFDLARCYANGVGTKINAKKAELYFQKALSDQPNDPFYLWSYAKFLEETYRTYCIQMYEKALSNNDANSGLDLFSIYTNGRFIEPNIQVALSYIDKCIELSSEQNDTELLQLARDTMTVFFERTDFLSRSPYLAPNLTLRYPDIANYLKNMELPRRYIVWLEVSVNMGHYIEPYVISESIECKVPYFCDNETELSYFTKHNTTDPLNDDIDSIESLIGMYYYVKDYKHPYKYQYWLDRLGTLAEEGSLEAQALIISRNYFYERDIEEGRDGKGNSAHLPLKDKFKEKYAESLIEQFNSGNAYAMLAVAKYMSFFIKIDRKKVLQDAGEKGLTDAWYELGKIYDVEYYEKNNQSLDGYGASEECTLAQRCFQNGLQCNNGKKVNACKKELEVISNLHRKQP